MPTQSVAGEVEATPEAASSSTFPSSAVAWYSVSVLMVMYVFSFIDRQIIGLLVGPIERDLHLSDTEVGLMTGTGFALLYTFLGLPIARLADRFSRRGIIAIGVLVWSVMATACGLARSATQMFFARMGVGVGEAALSPSAYSMITDSFPRSKLGRAFGVYNVGITMGAGIALLVGGIVVKQVSAAGAGFDLPVFGHVRAWQMVFIVTGLPGALLPLLLLTFREPRRTGLLRVSSGATVELVSPGVGEVLSYVWQNKAFYGLHFVGIALLAMAGYSVGTWLPASIERVYPVSAADVSEVLGTSTIIMNSLGMILAGVLCDRLTRAGKQDAPIIVALISAAGIATLSCFPPFMPTVSLIWVSFFVQGITFNAYNTVGTMAINQVTPNQFRAQVSSVYLFVVNALGLGVGPWLVGWLTEHAFHDRLKLRYALICVVFGSALVAILLLAAVRPIYRRKQLEAAQWR
jgi:MFS family permease